MILCSELISSGIRGLVMFKSTKKKKKKNMENHEALDGETSGKAKTTELHRSAEN